MATMGFCIPMEAQIPALLWSKSFGAGGPDQLRDSKINSQGDIINIGYFKDTVDMDPGVGIFNLIGISAGVSQMFVQKLDASGNFLWAKTLPSADFVIGRSLDLAPNGDIFIGGAFTADSLDMDPGVSTYFLEKTSGDASCAFILKLDKFGDFKWAVGHSGAATIGKVKLDSEGKLYVIGNYTSFFDTDPDPNIIVNSVASAGNNCFVERLDSLGDQEWIGQIRGSANVKAYDISLLNGNNPVLVGEFDGQIDFNPNAPVHNLPSPANGQTRGFILQLHNSGAFRRALSLQGTGSSKVLELEVDQFQNYYIAGSHRSSVDFDPTSGINTNNATSKGWFVSKMDTLGNLSWVNAFKNSFSDFVLDQLNIALDPNGSFHVAGYFDASSIDFNPGVLPNISVNGSSGRHIFLAHYDTSGAIAWAEGFGTSNASYHGTYILNRASDGAIYLGGYFAGSISFDPYSFTSTNTAIGSWDCFIFKLGTCLPSSSDKKTVRACNEYFQNGITFYNDTTIAVDTLYTKLGCDSIILLEEVRITKLSSDITIDNKGTLSWVQTGGTGLNYQWYRCDTDSILNKQTGTSYTPTQNGSYALIMRVNNCYDTSACVLVNNVGITESLVSKIEIYPNPVTNELNISGLDGQVSRLEIMDMTGRILLEAFDTNKLDVSKLSRGSYLIRISQKGWSEVRKVEKL